MTAAFKSATWNTTLHVVSDNMTVSELIFNLKESCAIFFDNSSVPNSPSPFDGTNPKAESTVQYYRASSVALTLDGYNNTQALSDDENAPPTPLPTAIDTNFLNCVNQTIGDAVPLIDNGALRPSSPQTALISLLFVFWYMLVRI